VVRTRTHRRNVAARRAVVVWLTGVAFLCLPLMSAPAQEAPPSAFQIVLQYAGSGRGLTIDPDSRRRSAGPVVLGVTTAVGSAALALLPAIFQWDIAPDEAVNSYGLWGAFWGLVGAVGMNAATWRLDDPPPVDRRAMYGALLDICDEAQREQAALEMLKELHSERRRHRIGTSLLSFLLGAVPVSGYFAAEATIGWDPAYGLSRIGFACGFALSFAAAWNSLQWPSAEERLYTNYLSAREGAEQ